MATQVSQKPANKHDAFIEGRLDRAERRIRFVDFATGLAGLVAGTLLFVAVVAVLDRAFSLSSGTRQTLLLSYLLAAGAFGYLAIFRPMRWRVNPLYAARQIEQTMPGQRNHLVNWVDLRGEKLPGVIRSSLGQRTAKDLSKVDVDQAISNRRAWIAAGSVGVMGVVLVALALSFGPRLFGSLIGRAFAPFGSNGEGIPSQTRITLLRPETKDATVTIGNPVTMVAQIDGKVPSARDRDAPCLLYRHDPSEPWRKRHMQYDESARDWVATVGPLDVGNGFVYKLTAGDAETPEYRITTRAAPLIDDFLATYRCRPYVGRVERSRTSRKLEDLRGTEVSILARTNRVVKEARLDFEATGGGGDLVKVELRADDPRAMRFRFVLDRPGKYRLKFTSAEGEKYIDPIGHEVVVRPDEPPVVRVTQPDKDIDAPANAQVGLRGDITDDIGIAAVTLRLKVVDGPTLAPIRYLADRLGKADFGTPRSLEYLQLLELSSLRDEAGKAFEAKAGLVLECWLEARDGCDFPKANVAESTPKRRIRVIAAKDDPAQKAEQEKQREDKKAHDKKQADDLKKQKAETEKRKDQDAAEEKEETRKREEERAKQPDNETPKDAEPKPGDEKTAKTAEEIQEQLDKQEEKQAKENDKAGETRGPGKDEKDEPKPGEGKGAGRDKGAKEGKPGAGRDEGKKDDKSPPPGESKDPGKGGESGDARGEGKSEMNDAKGTSKEGGASKPGEKPGESKPDKPKPGSQGEGKGQGKPDKSGKPGESKPEGTPPADKQPTGEAKDSQVARDPKKGDNCPCEGKEGAGKPGAGKGQAKPGGKGQSGEGKPGGEKGSQPGGGKGGPPSQDKGNAPGESRGGESPKGDPKPEEATAQDAKGRADDLNRGSEEDKQAAAKDLKDIANKAKDPQARKAAQEALDKARENFGKPGDKPEAPQTKPEDATGDDVKQLAAKARGNDPAGRAQARGQLGDIANKAKDEKARKEARQELDKAWEDWVNAAKDNPRQRDKAGKQRPNMLQLEKFREKVDPNVLKDLKMTKEQFDQFMRDYADLANRTPPEGADDKHVPVGGATGNLPAMRGKPVEPGTGTNDPRGGRPALPPPEYRDSRTEFLRRLNIPR